MKIFVIIAVLSIMTVVYGINTERLKNYKNYIRKCTEKKGGSIDALSVEVIVCAAHNDGKMLNANGEFIRDATIEAIADGLSDLSEIQKAQALYKKCHDEVDQSGVTGYEQAIKIAECSLPIVAAIVINV